MRKRSLSWPGSILAPHLRQFLEFRQIHGYVIRNEERYLCRSLDQYAFDRRLKNLHQIDTTFVSDWMHNHPWTCAGTKNTRLSLIRVFCRYLVRQGLMKNNSAMAIHRLRPMPAPPHIFTLKELGTLLKAADEWKERPTIHYFTGWTMNMLIRLLYGCGLRISEALNLKLKDIDFDENTLALWKTKFHKERLIPFSLSLRKHLQRYLEERLKRYPHLRGPHTHVFCHKGGGYKYISLEVHLQQLLKKTALKKLRGPRFHHFRHSFAVHRLYKWYQEGCDILNKLPLLSTYMGHVSVEDTQVYLTVTRALLREGNKRFQGQMEPIPKAVLKKVLDPRWIP